MIKIPSNYGQESISCHFHEFTPVCVITCLLAWTFWFINCVAVNRNNLAERNHKGPQIISKKCLIGILVLQKSQGA